LKAAGARRSPEGGPLRELHLPRRRRYPEYMHPRMNRASKEWSVICRALGEGRQILILRKGGIEEGPEGFAVTDEEFLLFPTLLHQSAEGVIPPWREAVATSRGPDSGKVVITPCAQVASWVQIREFDKLHSLREFHIWSDDLVSERFHRWSRDNVFALLVRVHELGRPAIIDSVERYSGCKSWITLEESVVTDGLRPILSNEEFGEREDRIMEAMR
jgi:hypothetical protein